MKKHPSYEEEFPGGLTSSLGERTDVSLKWKEVEPGKPQLFELAIINGASVYTVVEIDAKQIETLGRWMTDIARG